MKIFNASNVKITIVSDGNKDVVIKPKEIVEIDIDQVSRDKPEGMHSFNRDTFYVANKGQWYAKHDNCHSGADMEIYKV